MPSTWEPFPFAHAAYGSGERIKSKSALSATSAGTLFLTKESSNYPVKVAQLSAKCEKKIWWA
jgi:hypothetical protein